MADPDVMDTWATSSLSPQIASRLGHRPGPVRARFPMDHAPAGARDHPHLAVLDRRALRTTSSAPCPGRTRPSPGSSSTPTARRCRSRRATRSTPIDVLERYGADAVRWWAAGARPGADIAVRRDADEGRPPAGDQDPQRRKFVLGLGASAAGRPTQVTEPIDRALLAALAGVVDEATAAFEAFDYTRALEVDRVVLLVVLRRLPRAGEGPGLRRPRRRGASRRRRRWRWRCRCCCGCSRRSCRSSPRRSGRGGRRARCTAPPWPAGRRAAGRGDPAVLRVAAEVLAGVRKAKSEAKQSMRADVETATVTAAGPGGAGRGDAGRPRRCGRIATLVVTSGDAPLAVAVVLAPVAGAERQVAVVSRRAAPTGRKASPSLRGQQGRGSAPRR